MMLRQKTWMFSSLTARRASLSTAEPCIARNSVEANSSEMPMVWNGL